MATPLILPALRGDEKGWAETEAKAEDGEIELSIGAGGGHGGTLKVNNWKSYSFNNHYLTPTDAWSFTIGDNELTDEIRLAIAPRQKVTLSISGFPQCVGYVDSVASHASRGGTELTISGRDVFSPVVDSIMDPRLQFKSTQSLLDVLRAVFTSYGFEEKFIIADDEADADVLSAHKHGRKTSKKGKPLKSHLLHQLKPNPHEGAFAFAARITKNFGLCIRPSTDGQLVIIGTPFFEAPATYNVRMLKGSYGFTNQIKSASLERNLTAQPSIIFGSSFGSGGASPRDQFTACIVNPLIQGAPHGKLFEAYPKAQPIDLSYLGTQYSGNGKDSDVRNSTGLAVVDSFSRPIFLHDDNSKTIEELTAFLKRELAVRMHHGFVYKFEVEGHEFITPDGYRIPWDIDTIVQVDDDFNDVHQKLWILSRTFTKSRTGGTTTHLECILPHSLEF